MSSVCRNSDLYQNVTLVGGSKAGTFTDLGHTNDMRACQERYVAIRFLDESIVTQVSMKREPWSSWFLLLNVGARSKKTIKRLLQNPSFNFIDFYISTIFLNKENKMPNHSEKF